MSTNAPTASVAPVRRDITVSASQERCFRIFTAGIDRWWPREHHIGKSPLKELIIEPHVGGRWYSVCEDGSEVDVGRVLAWEPSSRILLSWQITAQWRFDPDFMTEVEVRFVPDGAKRTRVELEHRKLEAFGADAAAMRETFSADDAWTRTLALFGGVAESDS
ncbi:MAG: SRPBCC family protein [Myxococcota bacterium]